MKTITALVLLLFLSGHIPVAAFEKNSADSLETKPLKSTEKTMKTFGRKYSVIDEIKKELNDIMNHHSSSPNNQETWKMMRSEATDVLMKYYRAGKLMGTKPEQAFFVKIGPDTMTTTDIAAGKMIMLAGVAMVKPAEFEILRFERLVAGK
jgi:phage tail sheath protein FI